MLAHLMRCVLVVASLISLPVTLLMGKMLHRLTWHTINYSVSTIISSAARIRPNSGYHHLIHELPPVVKHGKTPAMAGERPVWLDTVDAATRSGFPLWCIYIYVYIYIIYIHDSSCIMDIWNYEGHNMASLQSTALCRKNHSKCHISLFICNIEMESPIHFKVKHVRIASVRPFQQLQRFWQISPWIFIQ